METIACNLCGGRETRSILSKWGFQIVECVKCGLVYVNPRNFAVEADDYFRGPYLSTIEENGRLKDGIEYLYREIIENIGARLLPGRLLDVGCAMGHFMVFARAHGWDVEGVECSSYAAAYGRDHFGLKTHAFCALPDAKLPANDYDASVLIEVIEHLPDPRATLAEVFRLLKPGGLVYLTTPNFASCQSLLLREEWMPIIPTGHLYYFTGESLSSLLQSIGFSDVMNITKHADFDEAVEGIRTSGKLPLNGDAVRQLKNRVTTDDAGKIGNGRAEGLLLYARKPVTPVQPGISSARPVYERTDLEGRLVRRPGDTPEDQKVYYIHKGFRHWVISSEWIIKRGMRWPDDVELISREDLARFPQGSPLS